VSKRLNESTDITVRAEPHDGETFLRQLIGRQALEFIPHRNPLLLVDSLIDIGPDYAVCDARIAQCDFLEPGFGVPSYIGIEIMAQCVAVYGGALAHLRRERPAPGLLLGTSRFLASVPWLDPDRRYLARCDRLITDNRGLSSFACELTTSDESVATANLALLLQLPASV
jgi:predicted hotdog family 3-hydroxylacyl-ACP dehydratase